MTNELRTSGVFSLGALSGDGAGAIPTFPTGSNFKISNGTVTGATYNGSGPTGSGYSSYWDTTSGSNYFSWTPSNASSPTAFTVIVDFETTNTNAYKMLASFDISHPSQRASFHANNVGEISWYDGAVKSFGLSYSANTRYVAIAVYNGTNITGYLVDTAAGTTITSADMTAAKGTSTVTPSYTSSWNSPSAIGRSAISPGEWLSGQVYGGAYWPSALTEAQIVDAVNNIRGNSATTTTSLANTGILSLSEALQVSYGLGAAAPAPVEVTYRGTVSDTNSGTTFTFSTPAAVPSNCLLVVCCSHEQAHNITGLSGGGYTWTEVASTGAFGAADPGGDEAAIFAAEITTPPSSVTLTCGGGVASGFRANATFYSIINHTSATPVATDSSSGSDTSRSVTLSNLSGGDAVIAYAMHQDGGDISFSGTTLDHSSNVSNSTTFASGSEYNGDGTTSQSIQATFNGNSGAMLLVAAAWR